MQKIIEFIRSCANNYIMIKIILLVYDINPMVIVNISFIKYFIKIIQIRLLLYTIMCIFIQRK